MEVLAIETYGDRGLVFPTFLALSMLIAAASLVVWLVALIEILRTDDWVWTAAGRSRLVWTLAIVFLGILGALLYVVIARPTLRDAGAQPR